MRPPRAGVIALEPARNAAKPLADADLQGWWMNDDEIIRTHDRQWITASQNSRLKWSFELSTGITGPITVHKNTVYVSELDGRFHALARESGKALWSAKLARFVDRSVVVNNNQLLVTTADEQIYSLDSESGSVQWIFDAGFPDGLALANQAPPVVVDDQVIFGSSRGDLIGINLSTGKEAWRSQDTSADVKFRDVIGQIYKQGQQLFVTQYNGTATAYRVGPTGVVAQWTTRLSSITASALDSKAGILYLATQSGDIVATSISTGDKKWTYASGVSIAQLLVASPSQLIAAGARGRILSLHSASGQLRWHDDVSGRIVSPIKKDAKTIMVTTGYMNIYRYTL